MAREQLQMRAARLAALDNTKFDDEPGDRVYSAPRVQRLTGELTVGELLYSPPCMLDERDPLWFDARKGQSPRWTELVAGLAARGMRLTYQGAYYWRVEAR